MQPNQLPLTVVHEVLSVPRESLNQMQDSLLKDLEKKFGDRMDLLALYAKLSIQLGLGGEDGAVIKI